VLLLVQGVCKPSRPAPLPTSHRRPVRSGLGPAQRLRRAVARLEQAPRRSRMVSGFRDQQKTPGEEAVHGGANSAESLLSRRPSERCKAQIDSDEGGLAEPPMAHSNATRRRVNAFQLVRLVPPRVATERLLFNSDQIVKEFKVGINRYKSGL